MKTLDEELRPTNIKKVVSLLQIHAGISVQRAVLTQAT